MNKQISKRTGFKKGAIVDIQIRSVRTQAGHGYTDIANTSTY
jgi:hypothetical protein